MKEKDIHKNSINAGQHINIVGSALGANNSIRLNADEDINISSAATSTDENYTSHSSTTGVFSSGGLSVTAGSQTEDIAQTTHQVVQVGSELLTRDGDITINAGNDLNVTASRMDALAGDISLEADNVNLNSAYSTIDDSHEYYFKQSGITGKVSTGITDTAMAVASAAESATSTDNSRLQGLQAARTAMYADKLLDSAQAVTDGDADNFDDSYEISISVGSSSVSQTSNSHQAQAVGSTLHAGGTVSIVARNDDEREDSGDINSTGSFIDGTHISLNAADDINLNSIENTFESDSESKSKSWGLGLSLSSENGLQLFVEASKTRGLVNQTNLQYLETSLNATGSVSLTSGTDTTLHGAQVFADSVTADIGGDLNIISQQDEEHYNNEQESVGARLGIGLYGSPSSFSFNYSKLDADSDYIAVQEQSGLFAGDGGFDITVGGNTDLQGAAIVGSNPDNNRLSTGSLSWDQLENHADYDIESMSVGVSFSTGGNGNFSASGGMASDSDSVSSTTFSVISDGNLEIRDNPGQDLDTLKQNREDAHQVLDRIFSPDKIDAVQDEVALQQLLSEEGAKFVGNYADGKLQEANNLRIKANSAPEDKQQDMRDEADAITEAWKEGGNARVAAHTFLGVLGGGLDGAISSGVNAKLIPELSGFLTEQGVSGTTSNILLLAASAGTGSAANGLQGVFNTVGQTTNNFLAHQESTEREQLITDLNECGNANKGCSDQEVAALSDRLTELNNLSETNKAYIRGACSSPGSELCQNALAGLRAMGETYALEAGETLSSDYPGGPQSSYEELIAGIELYEQRVANPGAFNTVQGGVNVAASSAQGITQLAILTGQAAGGDKDAQQTLVALTDSVGEYLRDPIGQTERAISTQLDEIAELEAKGETDLAQQKYAELWTSGLLTLVGGGVAVNGGRVLLKAVDVDMPDVPSGVVRGDVDTDTGLADTGIVGFGGNGVGGNSKPGWETKQSGTDSEFGNLPYGTTVTNRIDFELLSNDNITFKDGWNATRVYDEILSLPHGLRPPPSSYLSQVQINEHLSKFDEGAVRFTSRSGVNEFGTVGPDGGFVLPKSEFDRVLSESNGNLRTVEKNLGLDQGYLGDSDTVAVAGFKQ